MKMVHKRHRYSDMQLIGEAYQLLRDALGLSAPRNRRRVHRLEFGRPGQFLDDRRPKSCARSTKNGTSLVDLIRDEGRTEGAPADGR